MVIMVTKTFIEVAIGICADQDILIGVVGANVLCVLKILYRQCDNPDGVISNAK